MVAHILFPAVDPAPASLSRRWVQNALREELRFEGAVFTDDLSMGGAAEFGDIVARASAALDAGCDVLPVCNDRAERREAARRARIRNRTQLRICGWCACAAAPRPSAKRCTPAMPGVPARTCWRAQRAHPSSISRRATHERFPGRLPARCARRVARRRGHLRSRRRSRRGVRECRLLPPHRLRSADLVGKNLRLLQGEDRDQQELDSLREALRHNEPVRVLVRNLRKDGTVFVNDMQIYPLAQRRWQGHAPHRLPPRRRYARAHRRHRHPRAAELGARRPAHRARLALLLRRRAQARLRARAARQDRHRAAAVRHRPARPVQRGVRPRRRRRRGQARGARDCRLIPPRHGHRRPLGRRQRHRAHARHAEPIT